MSRLPVQRTRLQLLLERSGRVLVGQVRSTWRAGSIALLALLAGYYLGQNVTSRLLLVPGGRPLVVLVLVVLIELMLRLRTRLLPVDRPEPSLAWVVVDNLRVGAVFAVVLEAFKLGS
ncbi:MAG: DUF565 domain-containing protein [Cyanobacteriota bacterium]